MEIGSPNSKSAVSFSRNLTEKVKSFFVRGRKGVDALGNSKGKIFNIKGSRSVSSFESSIDSYISALAAGNIKFKDVPLKVAASHDFITKALQFDQKSAIVVMNSWDKKTMLDFIDKYDALPEAMLGKLFACGLDPDLIPKDIRMSPAFLSVAINNNVERLISEILNVEDIQSVRLAIRSFSDDSIKLLWEHGLSTNKLPSEQLSTGKFVEWAINVDKERLVKEAANPVVKKIDVETSLKSRETKSV